MGVPCPVHPKSHTHRMATVKPSTEGSAPTHRQGAPSTAPTRNPSHDGSNQNHKAKKPAPTISDAIAAGHRVLRSVG